MCASHKCASRNEARDDLDMMRSGEEIVHLGSLELIPSSGEQRRITGHCHRITTHQHQHRRATPHQCADTWSTESCSRRVCHDHINRSECSIGPPFGDIGSNHHSSRPSRIEVDVGISDRRA